MKMETECSLQNIMLLIKYRMTYDRLCGLVANPKVPGSIFSAIKFSEK
jgi:hypothetical protein